ncbi:unnamed protein product [Choristocarpus tenellus]
MAQADGQRELEQIHLKGLRVNDEDAEALSNALISSGAVVRSISLASNDIGDRGAAALARLLQDEPGYRCMLSSLDLRGNDIGGKGCELLSKRIRNNTTLTTLDLSSNPLGPSGGLHLAEASWLMLKENFTLEALVVNNTEMTETGFIALISILREGNNTVRELSIGGQLLHSREEVAVRHMARMLETPPCMIRKLDLSKSSIGDEGASLLRAALHRHPTLRVLNLSCNRIGITGGEVLAALLIEGSDLAELSLRANAIGDDGARAFKVVLQNSKTLRMLDLRNNGIGDSGLEALSEGIEWSASLERLLVWGNLFGQSSLQKFASLESGRFALVGVSTDVKVFVVDGVYQAAEKQA